MLLTFFFPTNVYRVTLEIRVETPAGLHVKCLSSLSDINQNCNIYVYKSLLNSPSAERVLCSGMQNCVAQYKFIDVRR
jgi:hypothetical protein